jgi:hypothetical protein
MRAPAAADALNSIHAKYIGIDSFGMGSMLSGPRPAMREVATETGSVSGDEPLVFDAHSDGSALGAELVDAVALLADSVPMDIGARVVDLDDDGVDSARFVERIEANTVGGVADPLDPTRICVGDLAVVDSDGDGHADYFDDVATGTAVCFDIVPATNDWLERSVEGPQLYRAQIEVLGDTVTIVDTRVVYFLIPQAIEELLI